MSDKSTLVSLFEQGDVPSGTNFADLINSCVNMNETGVQAILGPLNPTEIITPRVSAANGIFTGTMNIGGVTSAKDIYSETIRASALSVVTDISANGNIAASANRWSRGIVSAAGTAQATAAPLIYTINIGAGVADGQTTGFLCPSNQPGRIQYVVNGAASANLWPPTGGQINALASNAAFPMAASTPYMIIHTLASGYAVK